MCHFVTCSCESLAVMRSTHGGKIDPSSQAGGSAVQMYAGARAAGMLTAYSVSYVRLKCVWVYSRQPQVMLMVYRAESRFGSGSGREGQPEHSRTRAASGTIT
jgi:hypothetical protein